MSLQVTYGSEADIVLLDTSEVGDGCHDVEGHYWTAITVQDGGYKPVALEIMFVSDLLPLETNAGYCSETDTLVIGECQGAATLVEENDDMAAYWRPEEHEPDDLELVAVSLRNASKYLAPVLARRSG